MEKQTDYQKQFDNAKRRYNFRQQKSRAPDPQLPKQNKYLRNTDLVEEESDNSPILLQKVYERKEKTNNNNSGDGLIKETEVEKDLNNNNNNNFDKVKKPQSSGKPVPSSHKQLFGIKEISSFSGKRTEDVEKWVQEIISYSKLNKWNSEQLRSVLWAKLTGEARNWLISLDSDLLQDTDVFYDLILQKYGKKGMDKDIKASLALMRPQKPNETCRDYATEFEKILNSSTTPLPDTWKKTVFIQNLQPSYRDHLDIKNPENFEDAVNQSIEFEERRMARTDFYQQSQVNSVEYDSNNQTFQYIWKQIKTLSDEIKQIKNSKEVQKDEKWCEYHQSKTHNGAECTTIKKLRNSQQDKKNKKNYQNQNYQNQNYQNQNYQNQNYQNQNYQNQQSKDTNTNKTSQTNALISTNQPTIQQGNEQMTLRI